jgi:hypothetical protein
VPAEGARQLDRGLRGLDLDDGLVDHDRVAGGDVPGEDLGLGEAFAHVGEPELAALSHE